MPSYDASILIAAPREELKVALRQREAAAVLLTAAEQSYDAAIDSYRHGLATFVDVTNAQR